ncbi:MAG: hypothetical protein EOP83_05570 [Verrucomicrobiaceae bacterium]|nr:MAG: hypothetical protein EOP83_05570 [Verrucomicrobiaceae bacterium]
MNRFVRIIVAVLGCLHLCGGHWGVIQAVAWTNMLIDYSAQDGLVIGAKKTFDGEHPCCMCKAISEAKKQESKSHDSKLPLPTQGLVLKECIFAPALVISPPAPRDCVVLAIPALDLRGEMLGCRPSVPPPRLA